MQLLVTGIMTMEGCPENWVSLMKKGLMTNAVSSRQITIIFTPIFRIISLLYLRMPVYIRSYFQKYRPLQSSAFRVLGRTAFDIYLFFPFLYLLLNIYNILQSKNFISIPSIGLEYFHPIVWPFCIIGICIRYANRPSSTIFAISIIASHISYIYERLLI